MCNNIVKNIVCGMGGKNYNPRVEQIHGNNFLPPVIHYVLLFRIDKIPLTGLPNLKKERVGYNQF